MALAGSFCLICAEYACMHACMYFFLSNGQMDKAATKFVGVRYVCADIHS